MGVFQNNLMGAAAAAASAGGGGFYTHQIANSCRFNTGASSYMYETRGTPTNADKCTVSAWVKRGAVTLPVRAFTGSGYSGIYSFISFELEDATSLTIINDSGTPGPFFKTTNLYRDPSAWYHIVVAYDTTQGTAADRTKIYVNGVQPTSFSIETQPPLNKDIYMNASGHKLFVGSGGDSAGNAYLPFDGLIAEYVFIDGTQYAASDFGETKNGVWIPKDPSGLTFGNNGAYLKFESSSDLGNDSSGNNNDFTLSSITAADQMLDSPTFGSEGSANFATANPLIKDTLLTSLTEGNLKFDMATNNRGGTCNFAIPLTGKWYWEMYCSGNTGGDEYWTAIGLAGRDLTASRGGYGATGNYGVVFSNYSGSNYYPRKIENGSLNTTEGGSLGTSTTGVIGIAVNRDDNELKAYVNNTLEWTMAISGTDEYFPVFGVGGANNSALFEVLNFGQDGTFAGAVTAGGNADGNGFGNFTYAPPTDHLALCSANLPTAAEVDPAQTDDDYPQKLFSPTLYTGTDADINVPVGFQPDFVWMKNRASTYNNYLFDSNRGVTNHITSDGTSPQGSTAESLKAFLSTGYTYGDDATGNEGSAQMVVWSWRANGGTTATNTEGSHNTTVQVDPSSAFSIVTWAQYSGASTFGHGLGAAPEFITAKLLGSGGSGVNTATYHKSIGATQRMYLNTDGAKVTNDFWNDTEPTSTVFSIGGGFAGSGNGLSYCFRSVEGYCKVGSYEGNGDANGAFIYTGFSPAWIMIKSADSTSDWQIFDTKRDGYNVDNDHLAANTTAVESTTDMLDILSNGFKCRIATDPNVAETYIYLAMAHNPFQYATAR